MDTRCREQQCTKTFQREGQSSASAEDNNSLKNKRVSVRALVKLIWPTETWTKRLASSMARRIRQRAITKTWGTLVRRVPR